MAIRMPATSRQLVFALTALGTVAVAQAQTRRFVNTDCDGLALSSASGIPDGDEHRYAFQGVCVVEITISKDGKTQSHDKARLWSEAKVVWTESDALLRELLTIKDEANPRYNGAVESTYRCGRDPLIYQAECILQHHANRTSHPEFTHYAKSNAFTVGRTSLEEAAAFSKKSAAVAPPPPPPPPATGAKAGLKQAPPGAQRVARPTPPPHQAPSVDEPAASAAPHAVTFQEPIVDQYRVDYCFFWGEKCGQPAATAFCVEKGYAGALEWTLDADIGEQTPTRTLGDKRVCNQASCDGFFKITCSK